MNIENSIFINVAASLRLSKALGPGNRAVLWVMGCDQRCRGCLSPEWQSHEPAHWVDIETLTHELLIDNPAVRGITISGGEPMLQATETAAMLRDARQYRDFDVLVYSGYTLEQLLASSMPGVQDFLQEIDVLIDGSYRQDLAVKGHLFGSSNQRIHFLSNRIKPQEIKTWEHRLELHVTNGQAMMVGIPDASQIAAFDSAIDRFLGQENCPVDATSREKQEAG
jgi:anaerobic ribonucleoside-triphosphate reductase activating protein